MSTEDKHADAAASDDMKRKFKEALDKKNAQHRDGEAHLDGDSAVHRLARPCIAEARVPPQERLSATRRASGVAQDANGPSSTAHCSSMIVFASAIATVADHRESLVDVEFELRRSPRPRRRDRRPDAVRAAGVYGAA